MPKPPRFQSPRVRQFVISTAMTLLLAVSLLLAMAFSAHSPANNFTYSRNGHIYEYGHLLFTLPADWQPLPVTNEGPLGNSQVTLQHQQDPLKTLTIGVLPAHNMRSPAIAMQEAHDLLLGGLNDRPLIQTRLRHETAAGLLHVSLTPVGKLSNVPTPTGKAAVGVMNHLMVFSTDAREYVVIYHAENTDYDRSVIARTRQRLDPAMQLVIAIANLMQNKQYTLATADDYTAASLPAPTGSTSQPQVTPSDVNQSVDLKNTRLSSSLEMPWRLFSNQLHSDDESLHLLPHAGPPMFWTVRILGTITPTPSPSTDGRSLLAYAQANFNDALKDNSQIIPLTSNTFDGWKLVTQSPATTTEPINTSADTNVEPSETQSAEESTSTSDGDGLVRELWFVPVGHQRAIIAQLICEPETLRHATIQLTNAIELHIKAAGPATPTLHDHWQQAVQRGENVVAELRSSVLSSQKSGMEYGVLRMEELPFGFTMLHSITGDDALPVRGRELAFMLTSPSSIHQVAWAGDATLSRMWMTRQLRNLDVETLQPLPPTSDTTDTRRELRDGRLTSFATTAGSQQAATQWTHETAANFLPQLALFRLNPDVLNSLANQPEALVMYARSDNPPEPCWLRIKKINDYWCLTLRPTAEIEPTTIWFDQHGAAREFYWTHFFPNHGGSMRFSNITTDRQNILNAFKYLKPQIIAWEKEWQPDE